MNEVSAALLGIWLVAAVCWGTRNVPGWVAMVMTAAAGAFTAFQLGAL